MDNADDPIDLLIVDDDNDFRSTIVRRFRRRGFEVQEAAGGDQALESVQRRQFDVAILDMVMPAIGGLELLARLKNLQSDCQVGSPGTELEFAL